MKINGNIIAHRGVYDNKLIPENSLKAFQKAIDLNYPIELDVQLTKDNILIVFHDETLKRMTQNNEYIKNIKYDNLKNITLLETTETIPKFKDVLKLINGQVLLDIEIKNTKKIKETCEILVKELQGYKNFIIKSFNPKIVRYLKKNYPSLEVGVLIADKSNNKFYDIILTSKISLMYCKPDFIAISTKLLNKKKFRKLSKTIPTLIWTIEDKNEIINNELIYICNNLPFNK